MINHGVAENTEKRIIMGRKLDLIEEELTSRIIGASIEVHKHLGPGLLENAYQICLARELDPLGLKYEKEKNLPIEYKGIQLESGYRFTNPQRGHSADRFIKKTQ
jgi:hypothetical protein